jgi:transcriptional regulator with XRE-family HTH domain
LEQNLGVINNVESEKSRSALGKKFGERLKELRGQKGTTQEELAKLLNAKNGQSISAYENGSSLPRVEKLLILADFFGVTIDDLLGRDRESCNAIAFGNATVNGVNGLNSGTVTVTVPNGETQSRKLSEEEQEILQIFSTVNVKSRMKILCEAYKIEEDAKKEQA